MFGCKGSEVAEASWLDVGCVISGTAADERSARLRDGHSRNHQPALSRSGPWRYPILSGNWRLRRRKNHPQPTDAVRYLCRCKLPRRPAGEVQTGVCRKARDRNRGARRVSYSGSNYSPTLSAVTRQLVLPFTTRPTSYFRS